MSFNHININSALIHPKVKRAMQFVMSYIYREQLSLTPEDFKHWHRSQYDLSIFNQEESFEFINSRGWGKFSSCEKRNDYVEPDWELLSAFSELKIAEVNAMIWL